MISSTSNAKVKNIMNLKKSAKARKKEKCFLVEGPRMFFEIPKDRIEECYLTEEFEDKYAEELKGWHYELISENVCKHLSDTKTPQGVIAVVRRTEPSIEELLHKEKNPCFFLLENLQDPGNLGTIVRTAEGAGVTGIIMNRETVDIYNPKVIRSSEAAGVAGVIMSKGTVDLFNPKVVRATMGAIFRVPFVIADSLPEVIFQLKQNGVSVYAGHLKGDVFYKQDYRDGSAFLIGNEGNDIIYGGDSNDDIRGNEDDDILYGEGGRDTLSGNAGNDTIYGGEGIDTLYGDDGDDFLYGGSGDDTLNGGKGNDILDGGTGNDILNGEAGNDIYIITRGNGNKVINDTAGNSVLKFSEGITVGDLMFSDTNRNFIITIKETGETITINDIIGSKEGCMLEQFMLQFADGTEIKLDSENGPIRRLEGSDKGQSIYASEMDTKLYGNAGDDYLYGNKGEDILYGGEGSDELRGNAG